MCGKVVSRGVTLMLPRTHPKIGLLMLESFKKTGRND